MNRTKCRKAMSVKTLHHISHSVRCIFAVKSITMLHFYHSTSYSTAVLMQSVPCENVKYGQTWWWQPPTPRKKAELTKDCGAGDVRLGNLQLELIMGIDT